MSPIACLESLLAGNFPKKYFCERAHDKISNRWCKTTPWNFIPNFLLITPPGTTPLLLRNELEYEI